MFDLFAWLCLVAAIPLFALTLARRWTAGDLACAVAHVADRPRLHALPRGESPPASPIGCGAACCAITPRRRWCRSRCWCRSSAPRRPASCSANLRAAAAGRHGHRDRRHRHHAAVEAAASRTNSRAKQFCRKSPECTMSQPLFIAFVVFAAVMFFTPGPNNIMVLSSGLTYGFRRTVPHIAGITIGFAFMVGAVGLGFGTIFIAYPVLQTILKYAGAAYLIYLAAVIALSEPVDAGAGQPARPDDILGRGDVPVGQCQGLGHGDRHHYRLCRHCQFPLEHRHPGGAEPRSGRDGHARPGRCRAVRCARS